MNKYLPGVVCDECGKETVFEEARPVEKEDPRKVKMSEWPGYSGPMAVHATYNPTTYDLRCKSCGHEVSITR